MLKTNVLFRKNVWLAYISKYRLEKVYFVTIKYKQFIISNDMRPGCVTFKFVALFSFTIFAIKWIRIKSHFKYARKNAWDNSSSNLHHNSSNEHSKKIPECSSINNRFNNSSKNCF